MFLKTLLISCGVGEVVLYVGGAAETPKSSERINI
jgi:hypothetical protein